MITRLRTIRLLVILLCISNFLSAQLTVPFAERVEFDNIRGDLIITGNDIVGVIEDKEGNIFTGPNRNYNGDNSNGNYVTAYIDVDNDPTTFSSSEAGLLAPRNACSQLVYAGLYWSANYYMARNVAPYFFSEAYIDPDDAFENDTETRLIINNGPLAQEYIVRPAEFDNDFSDIQFNPVTSYLVVAQPETGCGITNGTALTGNIAVVRSGGSCDLRQKVVNAEAAGAVGVVIVSDQNGQPKLTGGGTQITIPTVSIGNNDITNANYSNEDIITTLNAQSNVVLTTLSTRGNDTAEKTSLPLTDPRKQGPADFRNIKFKAPGATNYTNVTASSIVFDGYRNTVTNANDFVNDEVPYVCYADVTNLLDPDNYFGTYTVANMNATQGFTSSGDGACGGWMLVAIYEDPQDPSKYISISDGFAQIFSGGAPVEFEYTGFTTLQGNQPVEVKYGVAALEGDRGIIGDELRVENTAGNFVRLGDTAGTINPNNNFFNSSITTDGNYITDRRPNSENTQGFDANIFDLPNTGNTLIGNNQTSATFQLFTNGDRYSVFFNAFSTTIIEPELSIIKRVYDIDGVTVITGNTIDLGSEVFYDLEIENIGNEDLVDGSIKITDILPTNTDFIGVVDATLPPGVTYTLPSPGVIEFNIPASIVETANDDLPAPGVGDGPIFIRFRASIANNCETFRSACSDDIRNTATAVYVGAVSDYTGQTLSSSQIDSACGAGLGEASNLIVNIPVCNQDITFCNDDLLLVAGEGFNQYTWSGPGIASPVVTTTNIYDVPNPQTGVYTVIKEDTSGACRTLTEEFTAFTFNEITNPILNYVDGVTVVVEDCGALQLPQILLCDSQTQLLETNFDPSVLNTISWQQLNPSGSCASDPTDVCSLLGGNCIDANWVELPGGDTPSFTVSDAGDYRILAEFDGGCIIPFYFSVLINEYVPVLSSESIECGNDGSVIVTNVPSGFSFSLTSGGPYTNTTGIFAISTPGDVTVYAVDTAFPGCEYAATINIPEINPMFSVTVIDPTCVNDDNGTGFGSIGILVTGGIPEYQYTISSPALGAADPIIVPNGAANNGNYIQTDLPPGTYNIEAISNRPSSGCIFNQTVIINPAPAFDAEVVLIAPATCDSGPLVQVNVLNGSGDYIYADSTGVFGACNIFEIPSPNPATTYTFSVSDTTIPLGTNSCTITASIDNISPYEPIVIDNVELTQPSCSGDAGQITVDISSSVVGSVYTYQLWDCALDPNCGNAAIENPNSWTLVNEITSNNQSITFTGVSDGTSYVVQVTHDNTTSIISDINCTLPELDRSVCPTTAYGFVINPQTEITADVKLEKLLSCKSGNEDAKIRVSNIQGGVGNYEWSLDNLHYTHVTNVPFDISTVTAGSYTVYIRSQGTSNCLSAFDVIVPEISLIDDIVFTKSNSNCTDQSSKVSFEAQPALSDVDIANGAVYKYKVIPNPDTGMGNTGFKRRNSYTFLQGVKYKIIAKRSDTKCKLRKKYKLDKAVPLTISAQSKDASCYGGADGSINVSVTKGTPPFVYTLYKGSNLVYESLKQDNTGFIFFGLEAGNYNAVVQSGTKCIINKEVYVGQPVLGHAHLEMASIIPKEGNENALNPVIEKVNIYPNPAEDIVNTNTYVDTIMIFDVSGKKVLQTSEKQFDISNLYKGIYFVRIKTGTGKIKTIKLMKK